MNEIVHPIQDFLREVPDFTPREMFDKLGELGYIGQEPARRAACLMAHRHVKRLKRIHLENITREKLPKKDNLMFVGPTGCGKTFLVEQLFQNVLEIPTVIVDLTSYSETGYVGQDVPSILTRLLNEAYHFGSMDLGSIGIVCIDEFDKVSSGKNNAVFSGAGTTKDVSGLGVQRELLKMLESADIDVPLELSHSSYSERMTMNTADIPFIACGAFSGFASLLESEDQHIGFGLEESDRRRNRIAVSLSHEEVEKTANFQSYGIMPELVGRFSRIVPFHALSREDLQTILSDSVVSTYRLELGLEKIDLKIEPGVLDKVVDDAFKRETGARGVKASLLQHMEEACFEAYSTKKEEQEIRLFVNEGVIEWDVN